MRHEPRSFRRASRALLMLNVAVTCALHCASQATSAEPLFVQEAKMAPFDAEPFDQFGFAVALSGDTTVVGAPYSGGTSGDLGSAHVFVRSGTSWPQQQRLLPPVGASGDNFANAVAVSGDTLVVGMASNDDLGVNAGAAYVFVRAGTSWSLQQRLTASDASPSASFGWDVSIFGDTVVVAAVRDATDRSALYVFTRSGTIWSEQQKLVTSDGSPGDYGFARVAVSDNTVVLGTPPTPGSGSSAGSAYVFERSGTVWSERQKLQASDAASVAGFGYSVSVSGDTIAVGAADDPGSAYVFVRNGTSWSELQKLVASDSKPQSGFGSSVSVSGGTLVVGARRDSNQRGSRAGAAYVFVRSGSNWTERQKLVALDQADPLGDQFGEAVAVSGDRVVVGAWSDAESGFVAGAAYAFGLANVPPPSLRMDDRAVAEGHTGVTGAPLIMSLLPESGQVVKVSYATAPGTASVGSDFTSVAGTLTFLPYVTSMTVTVPIVGDTVDEVDEDLFLNLSAPVHAVLGDAQGRILIQDDDGRPLICKAIIALPITITAQGRYCLNQNLSSTQTTGAAITIETDFVELDLKGFKIGGGSAGTGTHAVGIYALNRKNITIKNGNVRGFLRGVFLEDSSGTFSVSQGHVVQNVRADENTLAGIHVQGTGNTIRGNQVVKTTGTTSLGANADTYGIRADGPGARVLGNDVTDTIGVGSGLGFAIYVASSTGTVIERNRLGGTSAGANTGIRVASGADLLVATNRMAIFGTGIDMQGGAGKYQANVTAGVGVPYVGGTDAGNNN
jgi:hypothetical protein